MNNMIRESGELEVGVVVDGVVHRNFTLRPARLEDTYRAAESVLVPDDLESNRSARVAYQMAVDDAQILCQIETLGSLDPVPVPKALISEMDPDDMSVLRRAAAGVKKKLIDSRQPSASTGEQNSSLSAPDSA